MVFFRLIYRAQNETFDTFTNVCRHKIAKILRETRVNGTSKNPLFEAVIFANIDSEFFPFLCQSFEMIS